MSLHHCNNCEYETSKSWNLTRHIARNHSCDTPSVSGTSLTSTLRPRRRNRDRITMKEHIPALETMVENDEQLSDENPLDNSVSASDVWPNPHNSHTLVSNKDGLWETAREWKHLQKSDMKHHKPRKYRSASPRPGYLIATRQQLVQNPHPDAVSRTDLNYATISEAPDSPPLALMGLSESQLSTSRTMATAGSALEARLAEIENELSLINEWRRRMAVMMAP